MPSGPDFIQPALTFARRSSGCASALGCLCLFSSLQSATNVLPFTVLATGRDVFTLQAYSDWSLAAFFHTAVGVVSELPQAVQLLTTGLPGLAEPQFVLTTAGAPCLAVPLDLREFGGNIVVVNPAPSTSLEDLLQGRSTSLKTMCCRITCCAVIFSYRMPGGVCTQRYLRTQLISNGCGCAAARLRV